MRRGRAYLHLMLARVIPQRLFLSLQGWRGNPGARLTECLSLTWGLVLAQVHEREGARFLRALRLRLHLCRSERGIRARHLDKGQFPRALEGREEQNGASGLGQGERLTPTTTTNMAKAHELGLTAICRQVAVQQILGC